MNYTKIDQQTHKSDCNSMSERCSERYLLQGTFKGCEAPLLTTYKDVVYTSENYWKDYQVSLNNQKNQEYKSKLLNDFKNNRIIHYGLTEIQIKNTEKKLKLQKDFLNSNVIYDKITGNSIPLSSIVLSPNHSPNRYYGEIQNRVNTLINEADNRELVPLFMTITLPSEYHPFKQGSKGTLIKNPKYNGTRPSEALKVLTKRFAKLRNDRSLRNITKDERIYYRVNEPHKSGTPHTHILYYVPKDSVYKVMTAFKRLFPQQGNDIQNDINNSTAYIMKYINKTLPKSKAKKLTQKERYLNAWYSQHNITRFSSSRTLAPLYLYRLLYQRYSLKTLTTAYKEKKLTILCEIDNINRVMEIFEGEELVYMRNENYTLEKNDITHELKKAE